jgi:hypothetical protein
MVEYAVFFAALIPTLLVLLAAGICLTDGGNTAFTMPVLPIYAAS